MFYRRVVQFAGMRLSNKLNKNEYVQKRNVTKIYVSMSRAAEEINK